MASHGHGDRPTIDMEIIKVPTHIWEWHVFGEPPGPKSFLNSYIAVKLPWEVPWLRRAITRVLLGSKWYRLNADGSRAE